MLCLFSAILRKLETCKAFFFFSGMSHIEDMTDVSSGDTGCVDAHTLLGQTQILLLPAEPLFSVCLSVCSAVGRQKMIIIFKEKSFMMDKKTHTHKSEKTAFILS